MPPNLPANGLNIRRKPATSHHTRIKITIRTARLAEWHLHVNPQLSHHPKTLAHPRPKPRQKRALPCVNEPKIKNESRYCSWAEISPTFLSWARPAFRRSLSM